LKAPRRADVADDPITKTFRDRLDGLAAAGVSAGRSASDTSSPRAWYAPADAGDPTDVAAPAGAFDRSDANAAYERAIADAAAPAPVGIAMAAKVQVDYVGCEERAYRARQATGPRCLAHAAGRRRGHGADRGIFKGSVLGHAQELVRAAGDRTESPA